MRVDRLTGIMIACLAASLAVGVAPLEAKNPETKIEPGVGGRYTLPGGYLRLAVDDEGRVEGYYERDGVFGQIDGVLQGARFEGYWTSEADGTACATARRGSESWGRLSLEFLSSDEFAGMAGACGDASEGAERWTGLRR